MTELAHITPQERIFFSQVINLIRSGHRKPLGIRLWDVCRAYEYHTLKNCRKRPYQRCPTGLVTDEHGKTYLKPNLCPVFDLYRSLRKKRYLGVNKAPGLFVQHTQRDQPLHLGLYGIDLENSGTLPKPNLKVAVPKHIPQLSGGVDSGTGQGGSNVPIDRKRLSDPPQAP